MASKRIETQSGTMVVYHVSEAGIPSAHDTERGEWFFQPSDVSDGEVFSYGYPTEEDAIDAAEAWGAENA